MNDFIKRIENSAGAERHKLLAGIPQLERILESAPARQLCGHYRRDDVAAAVRAELEQARRRLRQGEGGLPDFFSDAFFAPVRQRLAQRHAPALVRVINATGVVLHTNLGRAPLAAEALVAVGAAAAGYCNLEFNLEQGTRGSRYAHVEQLLCRLTGAEAALVVNNCAAAVLLSLMALADGGEVLVSRGELIEIGGAFRMPEVIAQSGARLVEVGATNKTRVADYARAIGEHTRLILKSHPSNYRIVGFSAAPQRRELAQLAHERGLLFIEDLGSGTLVDLRRYGLPYEPTVQECVRAGADLVMFSGDKLLGGPQAGIVLGRAAVLARLKTHPLLRALRIDKLSLAALEATLRLYESPLPPEQRVPALRMLAEPATVLRRRAARIARGLRALPGVQCWTESEASLAGGGSLPETGLPTWVVKLRVAGHSPDSLARRLRCRRPALIARIGDDCLILDPRTVTPPEAREIVQLVAGALT